MPNYSNMTEAEILAEQARSRAKREAEDRGELDRAQVRKIVDDMDDFDGREPYRDDVAEIVAKLESEDDD